MWSLVFFYTFRQLNISLTRWRYEIWRSDAERYGDPNLIAKLIIFFF